MSGPIITTEGGMFMSPTNMCNVPTPIGALVPTNFVCIANNKMATKPSKSVSVSNMPVNLTGETEVPITQGAEPAVKPGGGLLSGNNVGKQEIEEGSSKVKIEGKPVPYLGKSRSKGNKGNTPAVQWVGPPTLGQASVIVGG
jgi:uncharacterized Zn-binding protein involved in type VI secretion